MSAVIEHEEKHEFEVSVERYHAEHPERYHFHVSREALLLHILDEGARKLDEPLLPDAEKPLDHLLGVYTDHQTGEPLNLEMTLQEFLASGARTHHFAIELVLAIRINTRWRVAPKKEMTPKEILTLADLPWEEYSLYDRRDSVEPLPPDTPVKLHRGEHFEAQRDGKYGAEALHANRES